FYRVGARMGLTVLPETYAEYLAMREKQLTHDLYQSPFTADLYRQYRKHLGAARYWVLRQAQMLVVPPGVKHKLSLGKIPWLLPTLYLYKLLRLVKLHNLLKTAILPRAYVQMVQELDNKH
ncbi:MAG: oxygenase MpaB family protein, partial [Mucilaginibacter sp.]